MKSIIAKSAIQGISRQIQRDYKAHKTESSILEQIKIPIKPQSLISLPEEKPEKTQPKIGM